MGAGTLIEDLKAREFWSPGDCARIYPEGADFFRGLVWSGAVKAIRTKKKNGEWLKLEAASVRAYFEARLSPVFVAGSARRVGRSRMAMRVAADPVMQALRRERVETGVV